MTTRSRIGVQFTVTREMIEAGLAHVIDTRGYDNTDIVTMYRAMRALEPGEWPEPPVKPGRDPYAHGGR